VTSSIILALTFFLNSCVDRTSPTVFGGWDSYGNPYGVSNPNYSQSDMYKIEEERRRNQEQSLAEIEAKRKEKVVEVKQYVCKRPLTEELLDAVIIPENYKKECEENGKDYYCKLLREGIKKKNICMNSGLEYFELISITYEKYKSHSRIYVNSNKKNCWHKRPYDSYSGHQDLREESKFIFFKLEQQRNHTPFRINKETLKGGYLYGSSVYESYECTPKI